MDASVTAIGIQPPLLGYAPSAFLPVASAMLPDRLFDARWAAQACHATAIHLRYTADETATFLFGSPLQREATQVQVDAALGEWDSRDLPSSLCRNDAFAGSESGIAPYRQLVAASSWKQFQRFPTEYADTLLAQGKCCRLDIFDEESPQPGLHSGHCFDLPFQFGTRLAWQDAPMLHGVDDERFEAISKELIDDLVAFVTGREVA